MISSSITHFKNELQQNGWKYTMTTR